MRNSDDDAASLCSVAPAVLLTLAACAVGAGLPHARHGCARGLHERRRSASHRARPAPESASGDAATLAPAAATPTRSSGSASRIRCSTNSSTSALRENHDLRIALARFDEANALLRDARFDHLPDRHRQRRAPATRAPAPTSSPGVSRADRDIESYTRRHRRGLGARRVRPRAAQRRVAARRRGGHRGGSRRAAGRDRRRGRAQLPRAARPAGAPARRAQQRRQPARDAAHRRGAARRRPRHRVRHVARPRAARDHACRASRRSQPRST